MKNEPLAFCLQKMGSDPEYEDVARENIKHIYGTKDDSTIDQVFEIRKNNKQFDQLASALTDTLKTSRESIQLEDELNHSFHGKAGDEKPNAFVVLTDAQYRKATFIGIILAIFN